MNITKTPVSMLQEIMVKKGTAPNYELIHNGGGTHQNIFTYQVSCDGLMATGTGRCKKDAKHEAATAMLATMAKHNQLPQLPASPCETPVRTPLPMNMPVCPKSPANVQFRNAIGELQDLCSTNNLDDPVYKETGDVGPPHARVFTIQCSVSTFVEEGTATTKKQAKHEAARKMVERITGVVLSDDLSYENMKNDLDKQGHLASKIAIARYPELSVNSETYKSKINWGLKIKDFYKKFKDSYEEENLFNFQEKLDNLNVLADECQSFGDEENLIRLKGELEETLKTVDIPFNYIQYDSVDTDIKIIGIHFNTAPDIHEVGLGKTVIEAEINALQEIIKTMKFLLS